MNELMIRSPQGQIGDKKALNLLFLKEEVGVWSFLLNNMIVLASDQAQGFDKQR